MRFLVTGGAGIIGSRIVQALIGAGASAHVLDDLSSASCLSQSLPNVMLTQGSILDSVKVSQLVAESDFLLHLAANSSILDCEKEPVQSREVNVGGTEVVAEAVVPHIRIAPKPNCSVT